jgi:hypothetical protein
MPGLKWVSGDYSAATDRVKIQYTKAAFEAALKGMKLPPYLEELSRRVLYEQVLTYPPKHRLSPVLQETGQLMGSVLSFPILCAINLVMYWAALEEFLHLPPLTLQLTDLPVMVNGDDISFRANDALYSIWLKWIEEAGFHLSLGKNYISADFVTMNSILFSDRHGQLSLVPYLNVGHLTGQSKRGRRDAERLTPAAEYEKALEGAVRRERAHKRFMHYHKKEIAELTSNGLFNLFVDPLLGGVGFPRMTPSKRDGIYLTGFQRRLGAYLMQDASRQSYTIALERPEDKAPHVPVPYGGSRLPVKLSPATAPLRMDEHLEEPPKAKDPVFAFAWDAGTALLRVRPPPLNKGFRRISPGLVLPRDRVLLGRFKRVFRRFSRDDYEMSVPMEEKILFEELAVSSSRYPHDGYSRFVEGIGRFGSVGMDFESISVC